MKPALATVLGLVRRLGRSQRGRWILLGLLAGVFALLFHPIFLLVRGSIGALVFALCVLAGFVLGPLQGMAYSALFSVASAPLWWREYGVSLPEAVGSLPVSSLLGWLGGHAGLIVRRVRKQTQDLRQANEELLEARTELQQSERLALFGEIAAGVAHELNQPLAIIGLTAEMARVELADGETEELGARLVQVEQQVERAGQIIRRLKSMGAASGDEPARKFSLNEMVEEVVEGFRGPLSAQGIAVACATAPDLPPLFGKPGQLGQVLTNLLLNARDALADRPAPTVHVTTYRDGEHLALEVRDTGIGMTPETRRRIFDPFFTTKDIGKGSGLGLTLSYRTVREHRGQIDVESAWGAGARFIVRLPLPRAEVAAAGPASAADVATPGSD